ncbi:MAG: hypothetical protein IGS23_21675 [Rivularia sp. T60_A2020_040]|nr:hypothetical protein [Rivularia sp. T60_A2020_040]
MLLKSNLILYLATISRTAVAHGGDHGAGAVRSPRFRTRAGPRPRCLGYTNKTRRGSWLFIK